MGLFLNSRVPFEAYRLVTKDAYFIDKTLLLGELISALGTEMRFFRRRIKPLFLSWMSGMPCFICPL